MPFLPVLNYFTRVTPKTSKSENEVYVLNRAVLTNSIKARQSKLDDVATLTQLDFDLGDQVQGCPLFENRVFAITSRILRILMEHIESVCSLES